MALEKQKQLTEDEKQKLKQEATKMAAFLYDLYQEHKRSQKLPNSKS